MKFDMAAYKILTKCYKNECKGKMNFTEMHMNFESVSLGSAVKYPG